MSNSHPSAPPEAQAQGLLLAGSLDQALPLLVQSGRRLLLEDQHERAARVLISAARLSGALGGTAEAEALLSQAEPAAQRAGLLGDLWRARAELLSRGPGGDSGVKPKTQKDPQEAWQKAATLGDERTRRAALLRLAELRIVAGDPGGAAGHYGQALVLPSVVEDRTLRASLLIDRAICLQAAGDEAGSEADLLQAETLLGPEDGGLRSRLYGQRALTAAQKERFAEALRLAAAARNEAVDASDVMAYMSSVVLIASLHMQMGEEVAAYDDLVRARVSLKDLLGSDGEQLVAPALAAFAERLGPRYETVRDRWIEERRAQRTNQESSR